MGLRAVFVSLGRGLGLCEVEFRGCFGWLSKEQVLV